MKGLRGLVSLAGLCSVLQTSFAEETVSDREVWNEGVTLYERGDVSNAVVVLERLMNSLQWSARNNPDRREFCARAAELVAKLKHESGDREGAAVAARVALWARPEDARTNRNFTRATDGVKEARETKRIDAVLKAAQGQDPGWMIFSATKEVRQLLAEAGGYRTNEATRAVQLADELSARASRLADVWIPVREAIARSATNQEDVASVISDVQRVQEEAKRAAKELGDLDEAAYGTVSLVEQDFTKYMKRTVAPPEAIGEDLACQSNAWADVEDFNGRKWQKDALDFTRAFAARFPGWATNYMMQAAVDTNKPPFTAADQEKVSKLAAELQKIQLECCEKELPPLQEEALGLIRQIQELLPKEKNKGNSQSPQPNPQPNPQQDPQQDQKPPEQQEQPPQDQKDQPQDQRDEKQPGEEQKDDAVEATLKKAQERNDEHEAKKKARLRQMRRSPNERDW